MNDEGMVKPKEPKVVTIMGLPTRRFVRITRSEEFKTLFYIVYTQPSSLGTQYKTTQVFAKDELDALCTFQAWCVETARQNMHRRYQILEDDINDLIENRS